MKQEICDYLHDKFAEYKLPLIAYVEDRIISISCTIEKVSVTYPHIQAHSRICSFILNDQHLSMGQYKINILNPEFNPDNIVLFVIGWYICYEMYVIDNIIAIPSFPWDIEPPPKNSRTMISIQDIAESIIKNQKYLK